MDDSHCLDIGGMMTHTAYPTGPVWTDVTAKLAITSFGAHGIPTIQIYTKEANPSDTFPNQSRHRAVLCYVAAYTPTHALSLSWQFNVKVFVYCSHAVAV